MLNHFNCVVQIVNKTGQQLSLHEVQNKHGEYDPAPPDQIPAGETVEFILKHHGLSPFGTAGSCLYRSEGSNAELAMSYRCPWLEGSNAADVLLRNSSAFRAEMIPNPLPQAGHPLKVQFTISSL